MGVGAVGAAYAQKLAESSADGFDGNAEGNADRSEGGNEGSANSDAAESTSGDA